MPFIHRFLTPREERNMVYKTFSNAVMKQYPEKFDAIMAQIWKMPFEKLLRASLTSHHVNIYVDLAASRVTGVSQYDRYVKHVRRMSRVIGEIEDTPFVDLPRTDDVLMDHLFMKVCEFCPRNQHQTAEVITNELYEQGYIEGRGDIIDMLEQPLLLQKRVKHIYKQIEGGNTPPELEDFGYNSVYPETVSLASIAESSTHCGGASTAHNTTTATSSYCEGSSDSLRSSASAIFTNNFDELFEQAAIYNGEKYNATVGVRSSSSIDYSTSGDATQITPTKSSTSKRDYSPQVDALHLEMVNEVQHPHQPKSESPGRGDLMEFSPGPRIKIVVDEDGDNDLDPLLASRRHTNGESVMVGGGPHRNLNVRDSDSDDILSSNPESRTQSSAAAPDNLNQFQPRPASSSSRDSSTYTRAETVLISKSGESVVQKRIRKKKKDRLQQLPQPSCSKETDGGTKSTYDKNEDDCSSCDLCDYEKRYSQMSLQGPSDEFAMLQEYLRDTGDSLPSAIDLPPSCDPSILLDPGLLELDPDEENFQFQPHPEILNFLTSEYNCCVSLTGTPTKVNTSSTSNIQQKPTPSHEIPCEQPSGSSCSSMKEPLIALDKPPTSSKSKQKRRKSNENRHKAASVAECC